MEGLLPSDTATFFEFRGRNIVYDDHVSRCVGLLGRSCDLRLLFLLARLLILHGDIAGTTRAIALMRDFLAERWDTVHPQAIDDDQMLRMVTLERLDERAAIELPLQCAPLVADLRSAFSYRDRLITSGELTPREGEPIKSDADVQRIVQGAEVEALVATRNHVISLGEALKALRALWLERAGHDQVPQMTRLPKLVDRMIEYLDRLVAEKDPARALAEAADSRGGTESPASATATELAPVEAATSAMAVESIAEAKAALASAALYFRRKEPSSPARLLIIKAEQLVGASFVDALRSLAPDRLATAAIQIDGNPTFVLPLETLGSGLDNEASVGDIGSDVGSPVRDYSVADRAEASALLAEVTRFYRREEPSSPIPALLERAQRFASRDFAAILKELAPPS